MTKTSMVHTPMTEALSRFLDVDVARHKLITTNLANIDTPGYKDKVVLFSDLFYQNLGTTGSGDPVQVGAGTSVGSLPSLFTQGSVSSTGVATDVAIQNAGFFAVQQGGVVTYTRAGNFSVDNNDFLVTRPRTASPRLPGGQRSGENRQRHRATAIGRGNHQPADCHCERAA